MKVKAILFDLDGTILDTAQDLCETCNVILKRHGFLELPYESIKDKIALGVKAMLSLRIDDTKALEVSRDTKLKQEFIDYYHNHICDKTCVYDGFTEVLKKLKENGYKTAVVTGKYTNLAKLLLDKLKISQYFDYVIGSDLCEHPKPHPCSLKKALDKLNVDSKDSIYLGDHINDIKAALACNAYACAVRWGYGEGDCGKIETWKANAILDKPQDLIPLIRKLELKT